MCTCTVCTMIGSHCKYILKEFEGLTDNIPIFWNPGKLKLKLIHTQSTQAMAVSYVIYTYMCFILFLVSLQCAGSRLPEWGFQQYEVSVVIT